MIRVIRASREPQALRDARSDELPKLRTLIQSNAPREDIRKQIRGYKNVRQDLWSAAHHKCCYCEKPIEPEYNDVEHYRPKLEANREPGSKQKDGYWWLAFTWENLLMACSNCNRSEKNAFFPLAEGSKPLAAEESPPGLEDPLALDPADDTVNPVEHIEFYLDSKFAGEERKWYARARGNSRRGHTSIEEVYNLNRAPLVQLRTTHVTKYVTPLADQLLRQLTENNLTEASHSFDRAMGLLSPSSVYVAVSYDALRHHVSGNALEKLKKSWPEPKDVGVSNAQPPIRRRRAASSRTGS